MSYELLPQPLEDTSPYTHDQYREDHELYESGPEGWTHVGEGFVIKPPYYIKETEDGDSYYEDGAWGELDQGDYHQCRNIRSRRDIGYLLRTHYDGYNELWDAINDRDDRWE